MHLFIQNLPGAEKLIFLSKATAIMKSIHTFLFIDTVPLKADSCLTYVDYKGRYKADIIENEIVPYG